MQRVLHSAAQRRVPIFIACQSDIASVYQSLPLLVGSAPSLRGDSSPNRATFVEVHIWLIPQPYSTQVSRRLDRSEFVNSWHNWRYITSMKFPELQLRHEHQQKRHFTIQSNIRHSQQSASTQWRIFLQTVCLPRTRFSF